MKTNGVILHPIPAYGHLVRTIELAKRLRHHSSDLSIIVLIIQTPFPSLLSATPSTPFLIEDTKSLELGITFIDLPADVEPPAEPTDGLARKIIYIEKLKPSILVTLKSLSITIIISALILDMFCVTMVDVAEQLAIPAYVFYTNAAGLAFRLYFPTLDNAHKRDFKDVKEMINMPGWPPLPPLALPQALHVKDGPAYELMVDLARRFQQLQGVLVNTFTELEPSAIKALAEGLCVPDGPSPQAYTVGPLIRLDNGPSSDHECIKWLDQQPKGSVIFLCFGSIGTFSQEQIFEITRGLELSIHRFLWSVRVQMGQEKQGTLGSAHGGFVEPMRDRESRGAAEAVLPAGFIERTGKVWFESVPQVAILVDGRPGR